MKRIVLFSLALFSLSAHAADTVAPTTPGSVAATPTSATQISLTWTASTDNVAVTAYLIERCKNVGCSNFAQIVSTPSSPYNNTGLTANSSYSYRIRARDAANNKSAYSAVVTVSTPPDTDPPTAPTGLSLTALTNTQLRLTWSAATDNVSVTTYLIERCTPVNCVNFAQIATTNGSTLTYTNTALIPNTSYSYRVRARDAALNLGPYSTVATLSTPPDTQAPSAPTGLTLTVASNTRINLAWTASTDDAAVTGYRIERCSGVGCSAFVQIATTTTAVTYANTSGLVAGGSYSYRVRATDASGNVSAYSTIQTAVTTGTDVTPPSVPTGLTATPVSGTQINLVWTASTDNQTVTGYRIERCQGASCTNFTQIGTSNTAAFNDTGRTPTTTYRYRIRAVDSATLLSGYSAIVNATTSSGVVDCD